MWSLVWQVYGKSYPTEYHGIDKEELDLILGSNRIRNVGDVTYHRIQSADLNEDGNARDDSIEISDTHSIAEDNDLNVEAPTPLSRSVVDSSNPKRIPWRRILSRREVWAILIPQFCNSWGYYIMLNWLPTYYMDHFGIDITKLGYFAVLPYAIQGALGFIVGIIGDHMIYKMNFRVVIIRKSAQVIGSLSTASSLLMAVYLAKTPTQGIALITVGLGLNAFTVGGVSVSQLDIAPRYAGIIFGLGNMLATVPGILGVALTGWILDVTGRQWNVIWTAASVMYFIGTSVYVAWMGDKVVIE
ncbi:16582_t:CDS:2 [Acaulospora colombiana]|uniref:16582_t:CDS:1 n=1 Tax=Acaulospora colombiana TaxID=27376 RepID=A0ACA9KIJ4_9GLOM|nr:16582_t:CDS:2 [Acaulospora colombiana]